MTNLLFEVFALWVYGMTPKTAIQVLSPRKYILYCTQVSQGVKGFFKKIHILIGLSSDLKKTQQKTRMERIKMYFK